MHSVLQQETNNEIMKKGEMLADKTVEEQNQVLKAPYHT